MCSAASTSSAAVTPFRLRHERRRLNPRHVHDVLKQPVQSLHFLLDDGNLLGALSVASGSADWDVGRGAAAIAVSGVFKSWLTDAKSALPAIPIRGPGHDLGLPPFFEQPRSPLDGDGRHTGDRFARARIAGRSFGHRIHPPTRRQAGAARSRARRAGGWGASHRARHTSASPRRTRARRARRQTRD